MVSTCPRRWSALPYATTGKSMFYVADLRSLPFADAELDGVICWYSLMYLAPVDRPAAYAERARALKPGAPLAVAFKVGDGQHRRAGRTLNLGIEFDIWWHSPEDLTRPHRCWVQHHVLGRTARRRWRGAASGLPVLRRRDAVPVLADGHVPCWCDRLL